MTRLEGKTVTLKTADGDAWLLLDSCEVLHGRFRMAGRVDSPLIATLFLDGSPILPVIVEPGQMDVVISNIHLGVSGTPLNDSLYRFISMDSVSANANKNFIANIKYIFFDSCVAHTEKSLSFILAKNLTLAFNTF